MLKQLILSANRHKTAITHNNILQNIMILYVKNVNQYPVACAASN